MEEVRITRAAARLLIDALLEIQDAATETATKLAEALDEAQGDADEEPQTVTITVLPGVI